MAYDPNDAEDKKIVKKLIDDALAAAAEEHEADIAGLKNKNKELTGKLREAREGKGKPEDIAALEEQLEESRTSLKKAQKDLEKTTGKLTEITGQLTEEQKFSQNLLVEGELSQAIVTNNIAAPFAPAVKAMLLPKAAVKIEGQDRKVFVGEKSLGDYVKEWSQGDEGKVYVAASNNIGTGAPGGQRPNGNNGAKSITRQQYEAMQAADPGSVSKFFSEGGQIAAEAA